MSDAGIAELTRGIEPYRRGNTGIDFVHLIESGRPGPHAMIMGLTHGNEPCGMWAVTRLLDLGFRPARGRLSLGLGNIAAYAYLQAGLESQTRFLHRDLNRLWRDDWIDGNGESSEARRARELRPHLRTVDVLLDLHSTASVPRPFFVLAELPKTRALADAMAWPATQQLMPGGCPEGRHLVDYGHFSDPATPGALSVECGRHSDPASGEVAWRAALRFLVVLGMLSAEQADRLGTPAPSPAIERYRVIQPCIARTDRFRLTVPDSGFVAVPRGAEVAWDGDQPVLAPFDGVVLAPRPDRRAGEIAFNWGVRLA
jgi:predicted deacylase